MSVRALGPTAFYRAYLREIRVLPHDYLRQFFRLKASDDLRAHREATCPSVRKTKDKRLTRDLKKLREANAGDVKAWKRILDLATGRRGKLRHELLEPIAHDPAAKPPPRLIPAAEKSRPPTYTPALRALLTSPHGRGPGALKPQYLTMPQKMPERGRPGTRDAELLGALSRRREVNVRWRAYTSELGKALPALELGGAGPADLDRPGVRALGLQGAGVLDEIAAMAKSTHEFEPMTRRQKAYLEATGVDTSNMLPVTGRPPRFLRRRYQSLLSRIPILTYHPPPEGGKNAAKDAKDGKKAGKKDGKVNKDGRYDVNIHPHATLPGVRFKSPRTREVSASDLAWINLPAPPPTSARSDP